MYINYLFPNKKAVLALLLLILGGPTSLSAEENVTSIRFAYIGSAEDPALQGINQGLDEANLQGRFLGQAYQLDTIAPNRLRKADFSPYIALLVAADSATLQTLAESAPNHPIFNLTNGSDPLREACLENLLHIAVSDQMKRDAIAQWRENNPDEGLTAMAWHPDYVKFAARDLNKRFKKAYAKDMDDAAWSGWAAVKMTSDTVARESITGPGEMLDYLKTSLSFDGQKGIDMNFRETGQLRQPLLIIKGTEIVGEVPVRGKEIDSIGLALCPK